MSFPFKNYFHASETEFLKRKKNIHITCLNHNLPQRNTGFPDNRRTEIFDLRNIQGFI